MAPRFGCEDRHPDHQEPCASAILRRREVFVHQRKTGCLFRRRPTARTYSCLVIVTRTSWHNDRDYTRLHNHVHKLLHGYNGQMTKCLFFCTAVPKVSSRLAQRSSMLTDISTRPTIAQLSGKVPPRLICPVENRGRCPSSRRFSIDTHNHGDHRQAFPPSSVSGRGIRAESGGPTDSPCIC